MSVTLYDNALVQKIQTWTHGSDINILNPNETRRLWEITADKQNDQPIKLPIISLVRNPGYLINVKTKKPMTFDGFTRGATLQRSVQLNAIPITVDYQIDVYTRYLQEADELTRNLIFNIINYPTLLIKIPYENMDLTHKAQIRLNSEVEDNSNSSDRLIPGQFSRMTIGVNIDDAYLFDVRVRDNVSIEVSMQDGNDINPIATT